MLPVMNAPDPFRPLSFFRLCRTPMHGMYISMYNDFGYWSNSTLRKLVLLNMLRPARRVSAAQGARGEGAVKKTSNEGDSD